MMSKLSKREIIDIDLWIEQFKKCELLEENKIKYLCKQVINAIIFLTI